MTNKQTTTRRDQYQTKMMR